MIRAAEEICGRKGRTIANPWTLGREEQLRELHERIRRGVQRRNATDQAKITRGREAAVEGERRAVREELREARNRMKTTLRKWKREWWDNIIGECEEVCH